MDAMTDCGRRELVLSEKVTSTVYQQRQIRRLIWSKIQLHKAGMQSGSKHVHHAGLLHNTFTGTNELQLVTCKGLKPNNNTHDLNHIETEPLCATVRSHALGQIHLQLV